MATIHSLADKPSEPSADAKEQKKEDSELFILINGQTSAEPSERKEALRSLLNRFKENQGDRAYQEALLIAFTDPDYRIRRAAANVAVDSDRILSAAVVDDSAYAFCFNATSKPRLPIPDLRYRPEEYKPEYLRMYSRMASVFMALRLLDGGHSLMQSFLESEKIDLNKIDTIIAESPLTPLGTKEEINILETVLIYQAWRVMNQDNANLKKVLNSNRYLSPAIDQVRKYLPEHFRNTEKLLLARYS